MPECAKTHLQQSRISKFSGGGPPDPLFKGRGGKGKGGEEREGKGNGTREGKDREGGEGWEGTGREGGRGGTGEGRGARHGLRPLETSSGSPPEHDERVCFQNYSSLSADLVCIWQTGTGLCGRLQWGVSKRAMNHIRRRLTRTADLCAGRRARRTIENTNLARTADNDNKPNSEGGEGSAPS